MIPDNISKLIVDMDFIAAAKVQCKPCFKTRTYVHKDSWIGAGYRLFYGETALECTRFIENLCLKVANILVVNTGNDYHNILIDKILLFRLGIMNLLETYKDDIDIVSSLNISLLSITLMLPDNIKVKHNIVIGKK